MENLTLWNKYRTVPATAQKTIGGGRLNGKTDINPMWRLKSLTDEFGACGVGWYYTIDKQWIETSMGSDEVSAFVNISLYYKTSDGWSMPVQGNGGSAFVAKEKIKGTNDTTLYVNDECYKMALTDAISVACKALGFGADIYWDKDTTKYNDTKKENVVAKNPTDKINSAALKGLVDYLDKNHIDSKVVCAKYGIKSLEEMTEEMLTKYREEVKK